MFRQRYTQIKEWPDIFYQSDRPLTRKEMIDEEIRANGRAEDEERRKVLLMRFEFHRYGWNDYFLQAWMGLRQYAYSSGRHSDPGKLYDDLMNYTDALCVRERPVSEALKKEWENFARVLIDSCITSKNYTSGPFGIGQLSEDRIARKIAQEIDFCTRILPSAADMEEDFLPLRECMIRAYTETLRNGEIHWMKYEDSL